MFLEQIGAGADVRESFRPFEADGLELGRVSFAAHEQYSIYFESSECAGAPAGRLRWDDTLPAVGDWIGARRVDPELALIEAVLPRRTQFSRRAAGTGVAEQVIAANVDLALVVCGLDGDFNLRRIERYLVLAQESGALPVVVLNKADLCADVVRQADLVRGVAGAAQVVTLSGLQTVEPLRTLVRGRTVALLGSSGAGKSTIANGLLGAGHLATAAVRSSDSRGRHTTTNRMLLPLPGGGAIIDNPGMRELQLWAGVDALDGVFEDVSALATKCLFGDCTHTSEPRCAVRGALESGALDAARWASYCKLGAELRHRMLEQNVTAKIAEKKRWKAIHKEMRKHPKYNR